MKKLVLFLFLIFLSTPALAVPGYDSNKNYGDYRYETADSTAYIQQLEANYHKKYSTPIKTWIDEDGGECSESNSTAPMGAYEREVLSPYYQYLGKTRAWRMGTAKPN